ncbi:hypothetical protein TNCV_3701541 [Trichonephila clavipes]|nr:hypothetical protein TNCV_3701541 [Trichonephila clavipes]
MDANSKSEVCFSPVTDSRGIKLCEFFSTLQLFTINEDYRPAFSAEKRTSYIDITAVGKSSLLSDDQYGFTPQKSGDALVLLCDIIKKGKRKNHATIFISLDIKGAFDNAW